MPLVDEYRKEAENLFHRFYSLIFSETFDNFHLALKLKTSVGQPVRISANFGNTVSREDVENYEGILFFMPFALTENYLVPNTLQYLNSSLKKRGSSFSRANFISQTARPRSCCPSRSVNFHTS